MYLVALLYSYFVRKVKLIYRHTFILHISTQYLLNSLYCCKHYNLSVLVYMFN